LEGAYALHKSIGASIDLEQLEKYEKEYTHILREGFRVFFLIAE